MFVKVLILPGHPQVEQERRRVIFSLWGHRDSDQSKKGKNSWRVVCACYWSFKFQPGQSQACKEVNGQAGGQVTKEEKDFKTAEKKKQDCRSGQTGSTGSTSRQSAAAEPNPADASGLTVANWSCSLLWDHHPAPALGQGSAFSRCSTPTQKVRLAAR